MEHVLYPMKIFSSTIKCQHKLSLIQEVLKYYSISRVMEGLKDGEDCNLRPKLIVVLSYYIINGYSDETKQMLLGMNINRLLLNQMNSELTRKKYLITDKLNKRKKALAPDIINLRDYFLSDIEPKIFAIVFDENKKRRV